MPSYVLHPLFAGRVVSTDVVRKAPTFPRGSSEVAPTVPTVTPLSTLPADQIATLIDRIQQSGGSLDDSEAPFAR